MKNFKHKYPLDALITLSIKVTVDYFKFVWCITKMRHEIKFCVKLQDNVTKTFDKLTQINRDHVLTLGQIIVLFFFFLFFVT